MNRNQYYADYMRKRYHKRREEAFIILGGKCVKCDLEDKKSFEIDHKDPKKKAFDGTRMTSVSREKFLKELKKCQLLCGKCHTKKTVRDIGRKWAKGTHGTLSAYRYCHCKLCKEAVNKWSREYKRKRRVANSTGRVTSS